MIMSAVVILVVGVVGYVGLTKGFYSSLLNMICVLVGAAVAFGVHEPLAYFLLGQVSAEWLVDAAWALSIALPFAITTALLRVATDSILGANVEVGSLANMIGGGVCGFVAGVVTAGMLVLTLSSLRAGNEFMGYRPVAFDGQGSPTRDGGLIFPAERIVVELYGFMSKHALATSTPLSVWRPEMAVEGSLLRNNFNEGGSRLTIKPDAFSVTGRYTVARAPGAEGAAPIAELTSDAFDRARKQTVLTLDGDPVNPNSYIEGYIVNFAAGARERTGKVVVGSTQVQLIVRNSDGTTQGLHPFAMVSQAEGDRIDLGRWRFDAPETFIASVGGASETNMAFEFLVPRDATPIALHVKGVRADISQLAAGNEYPNVAARDSAIRSRAILRQGPGGATGGGELDRSGAVVVDPRQPAVPDGPNLLSTVAIIPGGTRLNRDDLSGLTAQRASIVEGDAKFDKTRLAENRFLPRELQVNQFAATDDTLVVSIPVGLDNPSFGFVSVAASTADRSQPPQLIDNRGQRYAALGFVYEDSQLLHVRYFPGDPIDSIDELPSVSRSRPDQKLWLIFQVSRGVELTGFAIGNKLIARFQPAVPAGG